MDNKYNLNKHITFFYTDGVEYQTTKPIADEALEMGYQISFTQDIFQKAEIGFYCQHQCHPENSKLSIIMLHDLAQGHNRWPNFWIKEPWNKFDIGILPSEGWAKRWQDCSWDPYARPKVGVFTLGWPKADLIFKNKEVYRRITKELKDSLRLKHKRTVIYAPSWENHGKQNDFVENLKGLPVNLLLKQAPWSDSYPEILENIKKMNDMHLNCADNVHIIDVNTSIMTCLGLTDLIVSDESSVMIEGLLLDIPSIAVTDWLIPDCIPPRFPSVPFDFVIKTTKSELKDTVKDALLNLVSYKNKLQKLRGMNFEYLGNSTNQIMNLIECYVENRPLPFEPIIPTQELRSVSYDNQNGIFNSPNQYARPAGIVVNNGMVTIHGYQEYILTKHSVSVLDLDENLKNKYNLLKSYFTPHNLEGRSFLDLGANGGFFSFWALQNGSENVTALDMDEEYLEIIRKSCDTLGFQHLDTTNSNLSDWKQPAGVVLALALIHWVYSCTAIFGSIDAIIEKLANLTEYLLIIEWVDPTDHAIEFFHHTHWNQDNIRQPYTFDAFENALSKYFAHHELIGEILPTRRIFAAYKTKYVLDFSCPFPLLYPKEQLISSRCISFNPSSGISLWSRVYRHGDKICKQASLDLAEREAHFLNRLEGSEYFPRLLEGGNNYGEYSTIYLEDVDGKLVFDVASDLTKTPHLFYQFILHALNCLEQLEKVGITHRDIQANNILIRDGKPVLIDFGWAISKEHPYITPPGLSYQKTPPDGSFSNVYQMGILFENINNHKYLYFEYIISRMTDPGSSTRTEDIATLRRLFGLVYHQYYSENLGSV